MNENEITVKTFMPIPAEYLGHLLGHCADPEAVFEMLEDNPGDAERIVHGIAKEIILDTDAKVFIRTLEFSSFDSRNISHAVAYFTVELSGALKELIKVVGFGKPFLKND